MELLSINGLYTYRPDLFDGFNLPDGLNKDDLIFNLLMQCSELTVTYPDADFMKEAITRWSKNRLNVWERIYIVMYEEYDPFINIKRDEERTITQTRDLANTNYNNAKDRVNAWDDNSEDGALRDSSSVNGGGTDTGTVTTHEKFHVEGDSAITDAQDVARKEYELRVKYNLIDYIINDFKKAFCLLIY